MVKLAKNFSWRKIPAIRYRVMELHCYALPWLAVPLRVYPSHFSPSVPVALAGSSLWTISTAAPADPLLYGWQIPAAVLTSSQLLAVSSGRLASGIACK